MAQRLYPLQALLSVRHYREDAARNALRLEERRLVQAREEVGRRQAELERYRVWRQEEEERRYAAIAYLGASLSLEEVANFRASLGALATGEQERFQAVRQAEEQVRQQEQAVAGAQRAVALARREAAKIEKHRDIWQENAKREQEHLEDLELEEFATTSRTSDDA